MDKDKLDQVIHLVHRHTVIRPRRLTTTVSTEPHSHLMIIDVVERSDLYREIEEIL